MKYDHSGLVILFLNQYRIIGKIPSFARRSGRLTLHRFTSVQFSNLPLGFEHENWPKRGLAAGTLQFIGRVPRRPRCSLQEDIFPIKKFIE
jgi:hypothetical protein